MTTSDAGLTAGAAASLRRPDRFDPLTIAVHWTTLVLLIVAYAAAWSVTQATSEPRADAALLIHRSTGALIWGLTVIRLVWKSTYAQAAVLPAETNPVQRVAARTVEWALYALLAAQPITGFAQSVLRGRPFPLLGFTLPAMLARDKGLTRLFHNIHEITAWALLALIGLHASAALFHHFVRRDGVLRSMAPGRSPQGRE
jgi:cytochrome b561